MKQFIAIVFTTIIKYFLKGKLLKLHDKFTKT